MMADQWEARMTERERVARAIASYHLLTWENMPEARRKRLLAYADAALDVTRPRLEAADAIAEALAGHQIWELAEKVAPDEFVLWMPDGQVCVRLAVTHKNVKLDNAELEFVTCDLLDLLNARASLAAHPEEQEE